MNAFPSCRKARKKSRFIEFFLAFLSQISSRLTRLNSSSPLPLQRRQNFRGVGLSPQERRLAVPASADRRPPRTAVAAIGLTDLQNRSRSRWKCPVIER